MICADDLPEENPQRHKRRINPVLPDHTVRRQSLSDTRLGQDVCKRQSSVLQKLTPQKSELLPKPTFMKMSHP
jgi:hypothetical protein